LASSRQASGIFIANKWKSRNRLLVFFYRRRNDVTENAFDTQSNYLKKELLRLAHVDASLLSQVLSGGSQALPDDK